MKVIMIVSNDEFELPMAIYDSVKQASEALKIPEHTIYNAIYTNCVIGKINGKVERIEI